MAQNVPQLRIFLSSPGDVHEERDIARQLIKDALPYSPFIRGLATFDVISWDDPHAAPGLDAHLTPQDAINRKLPRPSECDLVIVILWSRIGTPLPSEFRREDGSTYQSGTIWEFEDGVNAAKENGSPTILLYKRTETPKIDLDDPEFQEKREQYEKVKAFFEHFRDAGGSLTGSFAAYETIEGFRVVLRQHLDSVVSGFLGQAFSEELGVTKAAVETMLAILKEQQVPPVQLEAKLKDIAQRHLELTKRLHGLSKSNDEPEITKRREQAAEAIELGDYDRADALLSEAVALDRRAIDELQEQLDRRRLSAAATIGQQGELERTRLNYRKAAEHFAEAASLIPRSDNEVRLDYQTKRASALSAQGNEFGDNPALIEAIHVYRLVLSECPRESGPLKWAAAQNNLGNGFKTLGERESGTVSLEAAVDAYRASLEEYAREREPSSWAATQMNLGTTLNAIGLRESRTESLELAVKAFNEALREFTRKRVPLEWARIKLGLGVALRALGERETGKEKLELAVASISEALEECTREREPFEWAVSQKELGIALIVLGVRQTGTESFERAVAAFTEALKECTRERMPLEWAHNQSNLGSVLTLLGERETGTERLELAVAALNEALKERKREVEPLKWARTQLNLGSALSAIGSRESDTKNLQLAVDAFSKALQEWTREQVPLQWALAQENLGLAIKTLGERVGDVGHLEAALLATNNAAEVYLKEGSQLHRKADFEERIAEIEAAIARIRRISEKNHKR